MNDQTEFDRALKIATETAIAAVAQARQHADIAPEIIALGYMQAAVALAINARGPEYAIERLQALLDAVVSPAVPWSN